MNTTTSRTALGLAMLGLVGGSIAWYWRALDRFPDDFTPPLDAGKTASLGQPVRVGGWGGGGGGVRRTPVIFVHGTTGAAWNFGVARLLFRLWGYKPDEMWALTYGWGGEPHVDPNGVETRDDSVDENLADLDGFVTRVLGYVQQRNPQITQVDIVGHSMGGVLARKWMKTHGTAHLVRSLVTLDSPNHGVDPDAMRRLRCPDEPSRFCEDFAEGSAWLAELNAPPEVPEGVRALAIYDGTDKVSFMGTPLSPRLEGADNIAYNLERGARVTHVAYVYDLGVLRTVFDWLQKGAVEEPSAVIASEAKQSPVVASDGLGPE
ncbi:MAG: alpha/beta fold hydrolase [Anaerolineae bacterium]